MLSRIFTTTLAILLVVFPSAVAAKTVIKDGNIEISRSEFEEIVSRWSEEMRTSAANDTGDRLELIGMAVTNKKLAAMADELTEAEDPEAYWKLYFQLQTLKRRFVINRFVEFIEVPDMTELAEERYRTEKEKYAKVPEKRLTSHILFLCPPGQCERDEVREVARQVLDELRAGAEFEAMVEQHSGDPGSKEKGGLFDRWFSLGEQGVEPRYTGGAFDIEEVGEYSNLVDTQFGIHIIRLDDIREEHYLPYDEVKDRIVRSLESEYRKLAVKAFEEELLISDDAKIDGSAMEEIFAPYKSAQ